VSGPEARSGRREALFVAGAGSAAAAIVAYAAMRVVERAYFHEPNPAILIWSDKSALFWRAGIAIYMGGLAAFGGFALAARSPRSAARWLPAAMVIAVAAIVAQAMVAP
jgi:hypothetical protein